MAEPTRVQLSRKRGWRMPPNTARVDRATIWGNPFKVDAPSSSALMAVKHYRVWLSVPSGEPDPNRDFILANIGSLRGKNLACWCPLDQPCHADVLLELANAPAQD